MILGADHIGEILGMEVKMYFRDAPGDVVSVLGRAIKDGCEVIIGGVESCQFAKKHGLECLLIHTGKPALWYAFGETKRVFLDETVPAAQDTSDTDCTGQFFRRNCSCGAGQENHAV